MHLDRDKGCHGDAACRKVASSGSLLWLGSEISHLQHKSLENGFVLCLSVLCCDCWVRFPIHDIGSPGFVCVKQSLRMCGWVAIVEAAVLLQYSTTSAFCNLWCYLHMFEDLRGLCGRTVCYMICVAGFAKTKSKIFGATLSQVFFFVICFHVEKDF